MWRTETQHVERTSGQFVFLRQLVLALSLLTFIQCSKTAKELGTVNRENSDSLAVLDTSKINIVIDKFFDWDVKFRKNKSGVQVSNNVDTIIKYSEASEYQVSPKCKDGVTMNFQNVGTINEYLLIMNNDLAILISTMSDLHLVIHNQYSVLSDSSITMRPISVIDSEYNLIAKLFYSENKSIIEVIRHDKNNKRTIYADSYEYLTDLAKMNMRELFELCRKPNEVSKKNVLFNHGGEFNCNYIWADFPAYIPW